MDQSTPLMAAAGTLEAGAISQEVATSEEADTEEAIGVMVATVRGEVTAGAEVMAAGVGPASDSDCISRRYPSTTLRFGPMECLITTLMTRTTSGIAMLVNMKP